MQPNLTIELMRFVESQILPRYAAFDKAHGIAHANSVIRRSLDIADKLGADVNMAYVVAAYHDLGLEGPRAKHHITSGKILRADKRLTKWFSSSQIDIMAEAVEDHRASASRAPRSIYGRIVAEADRDLTVDTVIRRTILFGLSLDKSLNKEQQWTRFHKHLLEKYSRDGYVRLWLHGTENERNLNKLRLLIDDKRQLRQYFDRIYDEEAARITC